MFTTDPTRFIDVGHSELAYRRVGTGPDLVLVHGWPLHSATWRGLLPHLAPHFTCHMFDLPGAGDTRETAASPIELRAHSETMCRAVDELGLDRYALMSHDSGGCVTRLMAVQHRDRVTAMVMGNTEIPNYHSPLLKMVVGMLGTKLGRASLPVMLRSPWLRKSTIGFGGCFDDVSFIDGEFFDLFVEPMLASKTRTARQMKLLDDFDWRLIDELADTHAEMRAPVQLIWGVGDPWFPLKQARRMTSQFAGGCELVELPGKLFVHEERPRQFAEHAVAFLTRHALEACDTAGDDGAMVDHAGGVSAHGLQ
jgi:haloalkane dehalogenase